MNERGVVTDENGRHPGKTGHGDGQDNVMMPVYDIDVEVDVLDTIGHRYAEATKLISQRANPRTVDPDVMAAPVQGERKICGHHLRAGSITKTYVGQ